MKNLIKTLGASLLLLAIFTGCSSKDMQVAQNNDALKKPENGNAKILFYRSSTLGSAIQSSIFIIKDNNLGKISRDNFKFLNKLGEGKFGKVFLVREISTGFVMAMKVLEKKKIIQDNILEQFIR